MASQNYDAVSRSAAVAGPAQALPTVTSRVSRGGGKRMQEEEGGGGYIDAGVGAKKGRSALDDLTNRGVQLPHGARKVQQPQCPATVKTRWPAGPTAQQDVSPLEQRRLSHAGSTSSSTYLPQPSGAIHTQCQHISPCHLLHHQQDWQDIDRLERGNELACTDYAGDIYAHLEQAERKRRPLTCYMETVQRDINVTMRCILVDWLVEVAQEYDLVSDTLFLGISYIDRFLSLQEISRGKLQLVGVTCLLIAAKYEEIYAPQVEQFCYITDNTYTREEVLAMEQQVLGALRFELTVPTAKTFLRRYLQAAAAEVQPDPRLQHLASYLVELTLMEYGALNYLPSQVAAAAVLVALFMLHQPSWSATLQHYSGFSPRDLKLCAKTLHLLFLQARTTQTPAIREKYATPKYKSVSVLSTVEALPEWLFQA